MKKFLAGVLATTMILEMGAITTVVAMEEREDTQAQMEDMFLESEGGDFEPFPMPEELPYLTEELYPEEVTLPYDMELYSDDVATISGYGEVTGEFGENLTWTLVESTGLMTISGTGAMSENTYLHDAEWEDYMKDIKTLVLEEGVTTINASAFSAAYYLESISFPSTLVSIESHAFQGCRSLTSVTIPANVKSIDYNCFQSCSNLTSFTILGEDTSMGTGIFNNCPLYSAGPIDSGCDIEFAWTNEIPACAFYLAVNLESIILPEGISSIGGYAFMYCYALESINLPQSLTSIDYSAFRSCNALTSVTVPSQVTVMGWLAFAYCENLESLIFESTYCEHIESYGSYITDSPKLTTIGGIGSGADIQFAWTEIPKFAFVSDYISSVVVPEGVTVINHGAFNCPNLRYVSLPSTLESCGEYVNIQTGISLFGDTTLLKTAGPAGSGCDIEYSCTTIPEYTFAYAPLEKITIPETVTSIAHGAFASCSELTSVVLENPQLEMDTYTFYGTDLLKTAGPIGSSCNIEFAWSKALPDYAFHGATSLEEVTLPDTIESIGDYAFYQSALKEFAVPELVTYIPENAFNYSNLESIYIPISVSQIGSYAFNVCNQLKYITYEGSKSTWSAIDIGTSNYSLYSVEFEYLGEDEFYLVDVDYEIINDNEIHITKYKGSSSTLTIPEQIEGKSITSIGERAFAENSSITTLSLPTTVNNIGDYAFYSCSNLESVEIRSQSTSTYSQSVGVVGAYAYANNPKLTTLTIPSVFTTLETSAFQGCTSLMLMSIPSAMKVIKENAFYNCGNIATVVYTGTEDDWSQLLFSIESGNEDLTSANILYNYFTGDYYETYVEGNYEYRILKATEEGDADTVEISKYTGSAMNLTIPDTLNGMTVTQIASYAFQNSAGIYYVTLPDTLETIGIGAFLNCSYLMTVVLPASLQTVENYGFYSCGSLKNVHFKGTSSQWDSISIGEYNSDLTRNSVYYLPLNHSGFVFGQDSLSFVNSNLSVNGYHYLTDEMETSLKKAFQFTIPEGTSSNGYNTIFSKIGTYRETTKFSGVCFGLASLSLLLQPDYLSIHSLSFFDPTAKTTSELTLSSDYTSYNEVKVGIYYYYLLQHYSVFSKQYSSNDSKAEKLESIVELLSDPELKEPITIGFSSDFYGDDEVDGWHRIVAYAIDLENYPDHYLIYTYDNNDASNVVYLFIARDFSEAFFHDSCYWGKQVEIDEIKAPLTVDMLIDYQYTKSSSQSYALSPISSNSNTEVNQLLVYQNDNFLLTSDGAQTTVQNGSITGDLAVEGPFFLFEELSENPLVYYEFPSSSTVSITFLDQNGMEASDGSNYYSSLHFGGADDTLAIVASTATSRTFLSSGTVALENADSDSETQISLSSYNDVIPWGTTYLSSQVGDITMENQNNSVNISSTQVLEDVTLICTDNVDHETEMNVTIDGTAFTIDGSTEDTATVVDDTGTVLDSMDTSADSQEHVITFDPQGGILDDTTGKTDSTTGKLSSLPTATRDGYSFDGWFDTQSGGMKITTEKVFTKSTTVYAQWTENSNTTPTDSYTVSFQANGGTPILSQTITSGETATKPSNPTKEGFTFDGWYTDSDLTDLFDFNTAITKNLTLCAKWTENSGGDTEDENTGGDAEDDDSEGSTEDDNSGNTEDDTTTDGNTTTTTPNSSGGSSSTSGSSSSTSGNTGSSTDTDSDEEVEEDTEEEESTDVTYFNLPIINNMTTSTFSDLNTGAWYYDAVSYVYNRGLMSGTGNGNFSPEMNTNRAMIVQVLYNIAGQPTATGTTFSDVPSDAWYAKAVSWASAVGVASGIGDNQFNPNGDMTREQLVVMLYGFEKLLTKESYTGSTTLSFNDTSSFNSWGIEATAWAVSNGIVAGKPNGGFDPQASATRAEVAQILMNFVELYS